MNTPAIVLLLFVGNDGSRSIAATANIKLAIIEIPDRTFALEIINVFDDPDRAWDHRVLITPTLLAPISARRIVGDLNERTRLRYFLYGLPAVARGVKNGDPGAAEIR